MAKAKLTAKQQAFCREYLVDLNATQAAIRAGYSEKTAYAIGKENLRKPLIAAAVQAAMDARAERTEITSDAVLKELAKLGFADIRKLFGAGGNLLDVVNLPDDIAAAVQSVEVVTKPAINDEGERDVEHVHKIRIADKRGALELLGKHLRLFAERYEHTGAYGGPIQHAHTLSDDQLAIIAAGGKVG